VTRKLSVSLFQRRRQAQCFEAETGAAALELYEKHEIDCVILDIGLPDMSGFELFKIRGYKRA
jgi:DNA-binding response OmpR family regulator